MRGGSRIDWTIQPDPYPDLVVERGPHDEGVGAWVPSDKHRLLCEYLFYSRHAWRRWSNRIFIDPFAGPGRIQVKGESFTRDGGAVLAWRTLAQSAPFTAVLIGDLNPDRASACTQRLTASGALAQGFAGPAVDTIKSMTATVPRSALCMAYIDPYNLELLSFSILKELAALKHVDLAINFCTMDLQRNVELEFDPKRARFDDTAPGWRNQTGILSASKQNVKMLFFRYWCDLVKGLGFKYSREMPLVSNEQGHPIYRMVFFARNNFPLRIWDGVARGPNRSLFDE